MTKEKKKEIIDENTGLIYSCGGRLPISNKEFRL
jgi:hypothetical protein